MHSSLNSDWCKEAVNSFMAYACQLGIYISGDFSEQG
jgi:hypothetical protein